jgi:transposase-like protein
MLKKRQLEVIRLMAEGQLTQKEICHAIGVNESTICRWKKDEEFMNELNSQIKENIIAEAPKAFKTISNLLKAKSEMVRLQAAKDILDRAGHKPIEKQEIKQEVKAEVKASSDTELEELLEADEE